MSKANKLKIEVEPRGLDLPKRKIPKELKKVEEKYSKPGINISAWRYIQYYLSKFGKWLMDTTSTVVGKAFQMVVPSYFWYGLLALIAVGMAIGIVLII